MPAATTTFSESARGSIGIRSNASRRRLDLDPRTVDLLIADAQGVQQDLQAVLGRNQLHGQ